MTEERGDNLTLIRNRQFAQLEYGDPFGFLIKLRELEIHVASSDTDVRIRNLRSNNLKPVREMREAALFCVGMSERIGCKVLFAPVEQQDFDFVATFVVAECQHFVPVQIKEIVPTHLNNTTSPQHVINGLTKYADSKDLCIAVHLNRVGHFDPEEICVPDNLFIGELWIFGSINEDQTEWGIWGDFIDLNENVNGTKFIYPCVDL